MVPPTHTQPKIECRNNLIQPIKSRHMIKPYNLTLIFLKNVLHAYLENWNQFKEGLQPLFGQLYDLAKFQANEVSDHG